MKGNTPTKEPGAQAPQKGKVKTMRRYYAKKVTVAGLMEFKVEMWTEHNHSAVYSCNEPIFDGNSFKASNIFDDEVKRICDIAERHGQSCKVEQI